jgi:copper resistance protein B
MSIPLTGTLTVVALAMLWPAPVHGQVGLGSALSSPPPQAVEDHAGHEEGQSTSPPATTTPHEDHAGHEMPAPAERPAFIRPITDADRAAAFPEVSGRPAHDNAVHAFLLFDQLEWQVGRGVAGASWDSAGWVGTDRDRFWFRTEGEGADGRLEVAQAQAFYGRAVARWWDVVAGIRQDVRPGSAQTWAAIGVQGLAPYWFEVEATAYVGASGRTEVQLETEYELPLTNRLILQPRVEVEFYGQSDPGRGLGAGLSSAEAEIRLRFEIRREFAPYVGVAWSSTFFGTAARARAAGERASGARLVLGLRFWM